VLLIRKYNQFNHFIYK